MYKKKKNESLYHLEAYITSNGMSEIIANWPK